ncbi:MAG: hypothetical protein ACJ8CR_24410, partial [Roseiflexaceae bacterium]
DQYVLKPIVKAMLAAVGRPRANVQVCQDPLLGGVEQALRWERISEIIDSYPQVDLFLLLVDRDGDEHRHVRLENIERQAAAILAVNRRLCAEHAWQEVEVWALAGCVDLLREWEWRAIRSERDPKEAYFNPYVGRRGLQNEPGSGRKTLGRDAGNRYQRVCQRCPEVGELEARIQEWIDSRAP